ncbi:MAG: T9SS type A sorting domain-containing protein, partial [Candidatus Marinimicrobia bacterium]|nr:T9SS type A sorting domain-containing protein [Candidatus Neomarinimicrobiota bacterium]
FTFAEVPDSGQQHVLKNNLSYNSENKLNGVAVSTNNSWNGFIVSANDFLSLDSAFAKQARNSNGCLPETDFLRLKETSSLVNAGIDLGLQFYGNAPDIGAFEWKGVTAIERLSNLPKLITLESNFPNPFNPSTTIPFTLNSEMYVKLTVFNIIGQEVKTLVDERRPSGKYCIRFDASGFPSGVYFYKLIAGNENLIHKMILMH